MRSTFKKLLQPLFKINTGTVSKNLTFYYFMLCTVYTLFQNFSMYNILDGLIEF
jgi:hypothetical protein